MASTDKTYVQVRGEWHEAEKGHALAHGHKAALKLACTGALVMRGSPESSARPRDLCERCEDPPAVAPLDALALRRSPTANVAALRAAATRKR